MTGSTQLVGLYYNSTRIDPCSNQHGVRTRLLGVSVTLVSGQVDIKLIILTVRPTQARRRCLHTRGGTVPPWGEQFKRSCRTCAICTQPHSRTFLPHRSTLSHRRLFTGKQKRGRGGGGTRRTRTGTRGHDRHARHRPHPRQKNVLITPRACGNRAPHWLTQEHIHQP